MRAIYFDCFAGVSGDMILGALVDLGLDPQSIERELASLKLSGYRVRTERVNRSGISAVKFNVDVDQAGQPIRTFADIRALIEGSKLSDLVKKRSLSAFRSLAEAEARVHSTTIELVHFHEVGAIDSIVDTVGAMIGFELLGFKRFFASSLRVGCGTVAAAHGVLPVPAPATALLLQGVPVYAGDLEGEFVTPTGAAILTTLCEEFGPMPPFDLDGVGYGAGSRDHAGFPNTLRVAAGEIAEAGAGGDPGVLVIETNIDDMNPQVCGYVIERALELGARDAFITPVQMKKGRPGILLTIVCDAELLDAMSELVLTETTTLGVRYYEAKRRILERSFVTVQTRYGEARVKVARARGRTLHFQPEYEDCAALARSQGVPLIEVQSAVSAAYRAAHGNGGGAEGDDRSR
jgi:hypothetical protein